MTRASMLLPLVLAGCAAVKPADKPVTLRLSPPVTASAGPAIDHGLAVAPVVARGLAGSLRYTYVDAAAPAELRQAATLFWEEPPPRVLERALVAGLRTRFSGVAAPGTPTGARSRVIAGLDRFEEASAGGAARALVAFTVALSDQPKESGGYCASVAIAGSAPSARAAAFDAAISLAVARFVADLAAGHLTGTPC